MDYLGITDKQDFLEHYGRIGMKWYQHIFGSDRSSGSGKKKPRTRVDMARASYKKAKRVAKAAKRRERAGSYNILTGGKFHNVRQFLANRKGGGRDNEYYKTIMKEAKARRKATKERYGKKSAAYVKARREHIQARRNERAHSYHLVPGMATVRTFIANRSTSQNKENKALYAKAKAAKKVAKQRLKSAKAKARASKRKK